MSHWFAFWTILALKVAWGTLASLSKWPEIFFGKLNIKYVGMRVVKWLENVIHHIYSLPAVVFHSQSYFFHYKINLIRKAWTIALFVYGLSARKSVLIVLKKSLVSGNAWYDKNPHPGGHKLIFNRFSADIVFSFLVSFAFSCILVFVFVFILLLCFLPRSKTKAFTLDFLKYQFSYLSKDSLCF